ncbi:MAG: hypothetical protein APR54_00600 [Candidatus Cloacimonas sp. SDB]|nr:MAG: hypothetical protein APR54_00600 [Candidatus Cloacimonas sp. SDB]
MIVLKMFMKKKTGVLIVILIVLQLQLFSGEIRLNADEEEIQLFNSNTNKILSYMVVKPEEKINFSTVAVDTLIVYSRILGKGSVPYNYSIEIAGEVRTVNRNSRTSNITKTLAGQPVSAYNSYKTAIEDNCRITITNIWENDILFKLVAGVDERNLVDYEYIRFSPQDYAKEVIINVSDRDYVYYQGYDNGIAFELEGPVLLKIISRMIFHDNFQNNKGYRFTLSDNGEESAVFEETAYRSGKAFFPDMLDKTPSSGDINIIKIPAGRHHLVVQDGALNRDLIFRFYINKSSIGVKE